MTARIKVFLCRCQHCTAVGEPTLWVWRCTGCLAESIGDESEAAAADRGRAHLAAEHAAGIGLTEDEWDAYAETLRSLSGSESAAEGPGGPGTPGRPQTQPWHRQQMLPDPIQTKETTP